MLLHLGLYYIKGRLLHLGPSTNVSSFDLFKCSCFVQCVVQYFMIT